MIRLRRTRRARRARVALLALVAIVAAFAYAFPAGSESVAGSAGVDTALPATDSALTVSGRGPFADLKITVNQTKHLLNQAVSVTWTGGRPTKEGPNRFAGNYLQLMQCWGDDDGTNADNPGPPPEQCVQGATTAVYGGVSGGLFPPGSYASDRIMTRKGWADFDQGAGAFDDRTGFVWRPFRAVDGKVVGVHKDPKFNPAVEGGSFWLDPYFNIVTTNEIANGRTGPNGEGAELFQVTTGVESTGLGCGQKVQPVTGGDDKIPSCWLVAVPRGTPAEENAGTPFAEKADSFGVMTSPVSDAAWKNRIAIPLEFNPVDSSCQLADDQRRIVGSEMASAAVSSWQPTLCEVPGREPFAYGSISEASARQQLRSGLPGGPGMIVVSRPIVSAADSADDPIVYAPLTASGTVIGFNVERNPKPESDASARALSGVRVARINLTPRLVAKLLTQSYTSQVSILKAPDYPWLKTNPPHLGADPDFVRFNPEFNELQIAGGKNFGGLVLPSGILDAARQVWDYVLADPEAKAWLAGEPDPWGMVVNPVYSTSAGGNTTGAAFADPVPESFPKSDPYCYQGPAQGQGESLTPPPLCGTDWLPFVGAMRDAARVTRVADDGARVVQDPLALSVDQIYKRDIPQPLGSRAILSLTDSASAFQFGVQTAQLSRAGDDGDDRRFIAPDQAGLEAGVAAMRAKSEPSVLEPDPTVHDAAAYPLTTLTYAAVSPLSLDATARDDYAAFIEYADGAGQASGQLIGQLPPGYAPLPANLQEQGVAAAKKIRTLQASPEPALDDGASVDGGATEPAPDSAPAFVDAPLPSTAGARARRAGHLRSAEALADASPAVVAATPVAVAPPQKRPAIARLVTPISVVPRAGMVIPALAVIALLAALASLEITKRPRRAVAAALQREVEP